MGDENDSYFHSMIKQKQCFTKISKVVDVDGNGFTAQQDIANVFVSFSKSLMGSSVAVHPVDMPWVQNGPVLSCEQQQLLNVPFTAEDVQQATMLQLS